MALPSAAEGDIPDPTPTGSFFAKQRGANLAGDYAR